jgi:hypothetical protein
MRSIEIRVRPRVITVLAVVIGLLVGLVVGGTSVALSAGTISTATAGSITAVKVVRDANPYDPSESGGPPTSFADIPGATVTMSVPAGTKALLLARFSATATCIGSISDTWCGVRILFNGVEGKPNGVNISIFSAAHPDVSSGNREAHMIERSLFETAGTYVVKVQTMASAVGMQEALVNWNLTVERIKA